MQTKRNDTGYQTTSTETLALRPTPFVTVRHGEDMIAAIVRHRRETGLKGGVSITFERSAAA